MRPIRRPLFPVLLAALLFPLQTALAAKPFCGDGQCKGGETVLTCPQDCGTEPPPGDVCGDGICGGSESCSSCESDCGVCPPTACNFDGICNLGEDCLGCSDCPGQTGGKKNQRFCCGLDLCDEAVCGAGACSAPTPVCGNGLVEYAEECDDGNLEPGDGCDGLCQLEPITTSYPFNQFNIGDSIGEAEAANGTIGSINHDRVWSTGFADGDGVDSLNERFAALDPAYTPNSATLDGFFNQAISGSVMADFATQARAVIDAAAGVPSGQVGMATVLLGANDVCADTLSEMTDPLLFEQQYRAGLDVLAASPVPQNVNVLISGLPAIYWLWESKRDNFICRALIWPFVPCQNLLAASANDCADSASTQDPDLIYPGDGPDCQRRKTLHARIRDTYNPILRDVLAEYQSLGRLQNAEYVDIFDVRFDSVHVNNGDCFHPSTAGHTLLSEEQWCRSRWSEGDPGCTP